MAVYITYLYKISNTDPLLANELYQLNKYSNRNNPKRQLAIKKIFCENNQILVDKKTLEDYGSVVTKKTKYLQECLQMPLNTINAEKLNLPDFRTGSASSNPYIEVYGELKTNSTAETKITLSVGKKDSNEEKNNYIEYVLDLTNGEITKASNGKIILKLDREKYFAGSETLFSKYVATGLINENSNLNAKKYDEIIQKFLKFTKEKEIKIEKSGSVPFRIYILPTILEIKYKSVQKEESGDRFTDYFGNKVTKYASTPTKLTKFLTFDDPAFTINCTKKEKFYQNLGIGDTTKEKVYIDAAKIFSISGLEWTFVNITNPDYEFEDTKKGILTQLYKNYQKLAQDSGTTTNAYMKIICVKKNNAKQEIIIDENLTMDKMKKLFSNIQVVPPPLCLEILIDNPSQNTTIWDTYLYVVKHFLAGNNVPKNYLLSYFHKILKQKRYEWLKLKSQNDQNEFFTKTDFCLEHLFNQEINDNYMDKNEEFAEKVGKIVKLYIEFKQKNKENDNSLSDILAYAKYDREKLRFVISRIGRGIQLSKIDNNLKEDVTQKIRHIQPNEEIDDTVASKDYSYFFFKGYYSNTERTA